MLNKDWNVKLQWLDSVWAGRYRLRKEEGLSPCHKDPIAAGFLLQDRVRKKKKRLNQAEREGRRVRGRSG